VPRRGVKPILAPDFESAAATRALEKQLKTIEVQWRKALEQTTRTWKDKPTFKVKLSKRRRMYVVRSEVSDRRWIWIDKGVKGRYIRPKRRGGVLAFPSRFRAKTKPSSLRSRRGFSGPPMAFSRGHHWPGIEPRNWTPMLSRRLTPRWRNTAQKAFLAYSYTSGHGEQ